MKNIILFLLTTLLLTASSFTGPKAPTTESSRIEVIFNRQLTFDDVVQIKQRLLLRGITLRYNKLSFDDNGKLTAIDFHVDCNDGISGSAEESNLTNDTRMGFYRDYSDTAKIKFATGNFKGRL
ncbi:hypothetical protein [Hymenobacter profundi]|uniref:Uncharacterized protein n=1 Tax=Hymenobacter profundi TaxID=1982110 RepID=A0ABS6X011_9BACT|nr:hypothetical protein [Hymenobacter profundi]MBW3129185.1 hypothetical protein [Hymenobacter profundi]